MSVITKKGAETIAAALGPKRRRIIHGKPMPRVDEPPAIARLALMDRLPDIISSAIKHQEVALAAMRQCRKVTAVANASKHDFDELVAWLRSIQADDNYLRLMEKRLSDGLVSAEVQSREISEREQAEAESDF